MSAPPRGEVPRTGVARGGTRSVVLGGAISSLAAYVFQVLGARVLGDTAYAPVGLLWTVQYLVLTIGLISVEAYVTRLRGVTAGVWLWIVGLAVAVGVGSGALVGGTADATPAWAAAGAAIALGFGLFAVVRGQLAAAHRYRAYAVMTGGESVLRLLAAAPLLALGGGAPALALTLPLGAALIALPWLPQLRRHQLDPAEGRSMPFLARTTTANGIAQVLLAAAPLVVAALGGAPAVVTVVFVTTTAARAPMVFVHSGILARILPPMRRMADQGRRAELARTMRRATPATALAVVAVTAAGAVVGPPLVALTFGAALRPSTAFAALTTASVALAMLALVLNQVAIALDAEARLVGPWLLALAAAALALPAAAALVVELQVAVASVAGLAVAVLGVRALLGGELTATADRSGATSPAGSDPT